MNKARSILVTIIKILKDKSAHVSEIPPSQTTLLLSSGNVKSDVNKKCLSARGGEGCAVVYSFDPRTWGHRQVDLAEFKMSLVYKVSSKTPRTVA